jgi:hypothetical protein
MRPPRFRPGLSFHAHARGFLSEAHPQGGLPAPKKRFRIEKLEERIAPSEGGNSTKLLTGHCGSRSE